MADSDDDYASASHHQHKQTASPSTIAPRAFPNYSLPSTNNNNNNNNNNGSSTNDPASTANAAASNANSGIKKNRDKFYRERDDTSSSSYANNNNNNNNNSSSNNSNPGYRGGAPPSSSLFLCFSTPFLQMTKTQRSTKRLEESIDEQQQPDGRRLPTARSIRATPSQSEQLRHQSAVASWLVLGWRRLLSSALQAQQTRLVGQLSVLFSTHSIF